MPPSVKPRAERASRSCIAIVTDHNDWHSRELTRAFTTIGMKARLVKLSECSFSTSAATGLHLPGFNLLPNAVLVREVSGGTFEAVTRRLGILHALREHGVPVWNDARAIERCVDKSMTTYLLAKAGLPTPPTWTVESKDQALAIVRRETPHGPLVQKPLFGSQGRGLRLIHSESDLPDPSSVSGVYYLQRFAGVERDGYRDFRLLVSGRRVIAAMARHAPTWITNVKQGGRPMVAFVDAEMKRLAIEAAACVGAAFAGVDLLFGADGRPLIIEVNSMPAWSGLQKVTEANIADRLASDLVRAIEGQGMRETAR